MEEQLEEAKKLLIEADSIINFLTMEILRKIRPWHIVTRSTSNRLHALRSQAYEWQNKFYQTSLISPSPSPSPSQAPED